MVLYLGGGPTITRVHVVDFPFQEDDRSLEVAFEAYGAVKSVKKQTMRGVPFALKPKVRVGLLVFISPRFLSLCLASTFCCKLLLANQKSLVFAVVLP